MASGRTHRLASSAIAAVLGAALGIGGDISRTDAAGSVVLGVGAHPLTAIHASAWLVTRSDDRGKELALLVYIVGPPGWTARDSKFESAVGDTTRIRMLVGAVPVEIVHDGASRRVMISGHTWDVARDNVLVIHAAEGDEPSIRGLGIHDLTFDAGRVPAVDLLARAADVREALAGPAPDLPSPRVGGAAGPPPPAEALALDSEGRRLIRSGAPGADARACSLFARAAALGWPDSQYRYGWCLQRGIGFAQDDRSANEWFRKAASRGDVNSAFKLGWSFRLGRGVPVDSAAAFGWFRRCAALGDSVCQGLVGEAFERGDGTPVHADSARFWYRHSAERGVPDAQLALVRLAVESPTGDEDAVVGLMWLDVLAAGVPPLVDDRLQNWRLLLEGRLAKPERRRARAHADAWLAENANRTIHALAR